MKNDMKLVKIVVLYYAMYEKVAYWIILILVVLHSTIVTLFCNIVNEQYVEI